MRVLERQLGQMDEKGRAQAVEAVRRLVQGVMGVGAHLQLPMPAVLRAAGAIGVEHSMGRTGPETLAKVKAQAAKVGPHVGALFSAF